MIKFHTINKRLKNNEPVIIRQCLPGDAEALVKLIQSYIADTDFIPLAPEEYKPTIEEEKQWIQSFIDNDNSLLLVAEHDGTIIGNIDLTGNHRRMLKHTAVIGMGMLKEWRNAGLGTALLNCSIEWAKQNPVLEILWLHVYADNIAGISLYKKAGFEVNGLQPKFIKTGQGSYRDNLVMSIFVK